MDMARGQVAPVGIDYRVGTHWWEKRSFALLLMVLAAVPLLYPTVPPLLDLPSHMARYRVELDGAQSALLSRYYTFHWTLIGNLGVDLLVWPLGKLLGLEPAVKLITLSIPLLTAAGLLWIAREIHGRLPPTAALALPFAYGQPFLYGFVNYALGMGLAFLAFALWLRLERLGRQRLRAALFVPISLAIWVCHMYGWGLLGLMVFGSQAVRRHDQERPWWQALWRAGLDCLPLAAPLLPMLLWRENGLGKTENWGAYLKAIYIGQALHDRSRLIDMGSMALLIVASGALLAWRGGLALSRTLAASAVLLLVAFIALPQKVFGSDFADERIVPALCAIALLCLRPRAGSSARAMNLVAIGSLAFYLFRIGVVTTSLAVTAQAQNADLRALDRVPEGSRVLSFVYNYCGHEGFPLPRNNHLNSMTVVRRSGFANDIWDMPGAKLLTIKPMEAEPNRADPSQVTLAPGCQKDWPATAKEVVPRFRTARFDAFDYLWLIDFPSLDPRLLPPGATPVYRSPGAILYRLHR
ncbi:hypothetical protein HMF7854_03515 [Sphingomonas ginkgonis]|uniref:Glycosyltransferase RgtA/B/C/D-like domain-containing protein n=1 Tax=Sphingomonas ginkgonis TaxID=2315330 RepID=A0A3S0EKX8_9SPHN|nr:hypothetical protein [Sphingomonas ginkgonis]RST29999.1 hypothetical protein HMF7854_03515 [Sphingomonas ginkgonis]